MAVNKVILLGNLGADPEVKVLDGGKKVANIKIATTESYKNAKGEKVENTEWHKVVFFGGLADTVEKYLRKGSQVYVEGKIKSRSYDDKDNIKRYVYEIYADNMNMLGGKRDSASSTPSAAPSPSNSAKPSDAPAATGEDPDDLPF